MPGKVDEFGDVPRYLLSRSKELRARAVELLVRELGEAGS